MWVLFPSITGQISGITNSLQATSISVKGPLCAPGKVIHPWKLNSESSSFRRCMLLCFRMLHVCAILHHSHVISVSHMHIAIENTNLIIVGLLIPSSPWRPYNPFAGMVEGSAFAMDWCWSLMQDSSIPPRAQFQHSTQGIVQSQQSRHKACRTSPSLTMLLLSIEYNCTEPEANHKGRSRL